MPLISAWHRLSDGLEGTGHWVGLLPLRWLLAWEYFEAGWTKLFGENWFAGIRQQFPWPFDLLPPALNWQLATWAELLGGVLLFLGLATRPVVVVLIGLTLVATWAVHLPEAWPGLLALHEGYAIRDTGQGNFKLPLLFLAMFLPLLCFGPGRLSLDAWLAARIARAGR